MEILWDENMNTWVRVRKCRVIEDKSDKNEIAANSLDKSNIVLV